MKQKSTIIYQHVEITRTIPCISRYGLHERARECTTIMTTTQPPQPRTDLSDGRSDGRTNSLACLRPEDNCNPQAGNSAVLSEHRELPNTGNDQFLTNIGFGVLGIIIGYALRKYSDRNNI